MNLSSVQKKMERDVDKADTTKTNRTNLVPKHQQTSTNLLKRVNNLQNQIKMLSSITTTSCILRINNFYQLNFKPKTYWKNNVYLILYKANVPLCWIINVSLDKTLNTILIETINYLTLVQIQHLLHKYFLSCDENKLFL